MASQGRKSEPVDIQLVIDAIPALLHTALPDGYLDFFNRSWLEFVGLRPILDSFKHVRLVSSCEA
jgi:hypothetical protein